jgi:hypothetical protein
MIRADLRHGTTAVEKVKLLKEHLSARTGNTRPLCVIGVVVFCDESLLSFPSASDGLVSIEVLGYVQAKSATPQSTMKKWIDSATWKQVPGGLTSDNEYMSNMRRFQDPNDEWTRLVLFGSIGANNAGRSEEKAAKRQALVDITNRASSRPASDTPSSSPPSTGSSSSSVRARFSLSGHPPRAARSRSAPKLIDERCDILQCDVSCRTAGGFLQLVRGTTTTMPGTMISHVPRVPRAQRPPRPPRAAPAVPARRITRAPRPRVPRAPPRLPRRMPSPPRAAQRLPRITGEEGGRHSFGTSIKLNLDGRMEGD